MLQLARILGTIELSIQNLVILPSCSAGKTNPFLGKCPLIPYHLSISKALFVAKDASPHNEGFICSRPSDILSQDDILLSAGNKLDAAPRQMALQVTVAIRRQWRQE